MHYGAHLQALAILLTLSVANIIAIWTFSAGFLSTRLELPHRSSYKDLTHAFDCSRDGTENFDDHCGKKTHQQPQFDRVVVLIVDALRVDFVFPPHAGTTRMMHEGQMPKTAAMLHAAAHAATAFKFVADVPTITMSRLKALLMGGLPTFLDIGSSFSASSISEDNLLLQLAEQGKRMVCLGDDTWMQMAPWAFSAGAHPYPSFNVKDLHTVDLGVWEHLGPYLQQDPPAWDLLIGHFLGVDHAGHSHGACSQAMVDKLHQVDDWLGQAAEMMLEAAGPGGAYEHALLLVLGDHAQTLSGDHGGGSPDETDSLLLAFNMGEWHAVRTAMQEHGRTTSSADAESDALEVGASSSDESSNDSQGGSSNSSSSSSSSRWTVPCGCSEALAAERLQLLAAAGGSMAADCLQNSRQADGMQEGEAPLHAAGAHGQHNAAAAGAMLLEGVFRGSCYKGVMPQVDFAASLAVSLGLPIPFGSVGKVDPDWWAMAQRPSRKGGFDGLGGAGAAASMHNLCGDPHGTGAQERGTTGAWERRSTAASHGGDVRMSSNDSGINGDSGAATLPTASTANLPSILGGYVDALRLNAWQVHRYLNTYASLASLPETHLATSNRLYEEAVHQYNRWSSVVLDVDAESNRCSACDPASATVSDASGSNSSTCSATSAAADTLEAGQKLLSYLNHAALVAREKFSGLDLRLMAWGCCLMVASLLLHVVVVARQYTGPWHALLTVECIAAMLLQLFHACSLFGVTWIMGEGKLQCYTMLLLLATMWASTLFSMRAARQQAAALNAALAAAPASSQLPPCHAPSAAVQWPCSWLPWLQLNSSALLGLACGFGLQIFGLHDRSGEDPHDKTQPQDLLELGGGLAGSRAPGVSWQGVMQQAVVLLPALVMPLVLAACHHLLANLTGPQLRSKIPPGAGSTSSTACHPPCNGHALGPGDTLNLQAVSNRSTVAPVQLSEAGPTWQLRLRLPWWSLALACVLQHGCIAAWWLAQAFGLEHQSSALLLQQLKVKACALENAWWHRLFNSVVKHTFLKSFFSAASLVIRQLQLQGSVSLAISHVFELPINLMLPRVVYVVALGVLVTELLCGLLRLVGYAALQTSRGNCTSILHIRASGRQLSTRMGQHIWLVGCMLAPVTLLLGYRGPATLLAGLCMAASVVALCVAKHRSVSTRRLLSHALVQLTARQAGAMHLPAELACAEALVENNGEEALWGIACPLAWAMTGVLLFFCSGHFCEFNGLQYTSPFIGFDDMAWYRSGAMLTANTFGAMAVTAMALPLLAYVQEAMRCEEARAWLGLSSLDVPAAVPPAKSSHVGRGLRSCSHLSAIVDDMHFDGVRANGGDVGWGLIPVAVGSPAQPSRNMPPLSVAMYFTVRTLSASTSLLCAAVLHKNVVVWAIIAPKLVFEMFFVAVAALMLTLGMIVSC